MLPTSLQPKPDWNQLPPDCQPIQSKWLKFRVAIPIFAGLAAYGAVAVRHLRAIPLRGINPTYPLAALATILFLQTLYALSAPFLARCSRQKAGPILEGSDGQMLPYWEIQKRYGSLLQKNIICSADINLLARKEIDLLSFQKFIGKHHHHILKHLDDEAKITLRQKFYAQDFSTWPCLTETKKLCWVIDLQLDEKIYGPKILSSSTHKNFILSYCRDWVVFLHNYDKEAVAFVTDETVKESLKEAYLKYAEYYLSLEDERGYCVKNFGAEAYHNLQIRKWSYEISGLKRTPYNKFIEGKNLDEIKAFIQEDPDFKERVKRSFQRMPSALQQEPRFADMRTLLNVSV